MREIQIKILVDWEDYDDVHPELVLEDTGMLDRLKDGVTLLNVLRSNKSILFSLR